MECLRADQTAAGGRRVEFLKYLHKTLHYTLDTCSDIVLCEGQYEANGEEQSSPPALSGFGTPRKLNGYYVKVPQE